MTEQDADLRGLIERGDTAGLETALKAGADVRQGDRWGVPVLAQAAARGDIDAVRLLLDYGADANQTSEVGNSPLMAAAARGNLEVIEALLAAGADPESKNKWGLGAADWAQWPANPAEVLALLHSRGG